jgi:hypothetical protein
LEAAAARQGCAQLTNASDGVRAANVQRRRRAPPIRVRNTTSGTPCDPR